MKMVTDPTLDDDRWGLFVKYKRKFWFEENDYDVPESYFYQNGEEIQPNTIELVKRFLKQVRESRGYDVDCYPPPMFKSPFEPLPLEKMHQGTSNIDKRGYARVVGAADFSRETSNFLYRFVIYDKKQANLLQCEIPRYVNIYVVAQLNQLYLMFNFMLSLKEDGDSIEEVVARSFLMRTKNRDKLAAAIEDYAPAS
ncbi:S-methyl-5'-thioadenosine phosphorylase [Striga asiatica]|uniref:S-methyl-5'-thioadenosine phosphorylase n=1 Tax=Striga asiatica TaxID=4170 RepID=A0A5A7R0X4_STRAF|nr:S-methyl-5'-thioadenosine phosphorylase [Striga asiatica]